LSVKLCVREKIESFAQGIEQFVAKVVKKATPKENLIKCGSGMATFI
jgi:hypothetical protein